MAPKAAVTLSARAKAVMGLENDWRYCTLCKIGKLASRHVFGKGSFTPEVVFVGEGPGRSEDVLGLPFVGRAGKLLDQAIRDSGAVPSQFYFTNLVQCRPADQLGGPNRPPSEDEIFKCNPRLKLLLVILQPKAVVWLGRVPGDAALAYRPMWPEGVVHYQLPHPAWLLRTGGASSTQYKDFVKRLTEVFKHGR